MPVYLDHLPMIIDSYAGGGGAFTRIGCTIMASECQKIAREAMTCDEDRITVLEGGRK